jgi:hypothetical protein
VADTLLQRALAAGLLAAAAFAAPEPPAIRLVPLRDGLRDIAPEGDLGRLGETGLFKTAQRAGVDLLRPPHPILPFRYEDGRLFYLFYKTTENALGDRAYLIQRIRKVERSWKTPDAAPEERVTWLVEVFKLRGGELKREDQHYGSFGLHGDDRREIVKEYEIGFGEIEGVCEGNAWPYDAGDLYRELQPYGEDEGLFPRVRFDAVRRWTLTVTLDARGGFAVRSPELGFDAPGRLPARGDTLAPGDPDSAGIVLLEGRGPDGITVGETARGALVRVLGEPLAKVPAGQGHENLSFKGSLTVNLDEEGKVNTILTRAGFAGRTGRGAAHGMYRDEVARLYGLPAGAFDAEHWRFEGVQLSFDGFDRVKRIVILRK